MPSWRTLETDTRQTFHQTFVTICRYRVHNHYRAKLVSCLEVLHDEDLWRKDTGGNSIESIAHHMLAHVHLFESIVLQSPEGKEMPVKGIEGDFPERRQGRDALRAEVDEGFNRFDGVLATLHDSDAPECVEPANLNRLFHVVEHLSYHLGQIVMLTRMRTGHEFHFVEAGINEAQLRGLLNG